MYRLGAVSYHALTAARPAEAYQFDPDYDLERTIIDRQYTPVTRHDSSLRPAVDAVLKQAMEPNPDARYDSTDLFRKSLNGSL
ncbi:hypothetical protein [Halapricum sp. CBA1109]|uniref:hypothetical protein n=1 Tax=Halapricum sp. CBA1109 TaxID=2668068 RepID=UPI0018D26575|nr:hypothetical protein [Halapricum sp. CBA1109]